MLSLENSVRLKGILTETHINLGRVFTERRQLQDLKVIPSRPSSTGMQRSAIIWRPDRDSAPPEDTKFGLE